MWSFNTFDIISDNSIVDDRTVTSQYVLWFLDFGCDEMSLLSGRLYTNKTMLNLYAINSNYHTVIFNVLSQSSVVLITFSHFFITWIPNSQNKSKGVCHLLRVFFDISFDKTRVINHVFGGLWRYLETHCYIKAGLGCRNSSASSRIGICYFCWEGKGGPLQEPYRMTACFWQNCQKHSSQSSNGTLLGFKCLVCYMHPVSDLNCEWTA